MVGSPSRLDELMQKDVEVWDEGDVHGSSSVITS